MIIHTLFERPTAEPVSLDEVKAHLRVTDSFEDDLIKALIVTARGVVEDRCQRCLMPQTWRLVLDGFPQSGNRMLDAIRIPRAPHILVEKVEYLDTVGSLTLMSPEAYTVQSSEYQTLLRPAPDLVWPDTAVNENAVIITHKVGYADADSVPAPIKAWMKIFIATLYDNRDAIVRGEAKTSNLMPRGFVDALLDSYMVPAVA